MDAPHSGQGHGGCAMMLVLAPGGREGRKWLIDGKVRSWECMLRAWRLTDKAVARSKRGVGKARGLQL